MPRDACHYVARMNLTLDVEVVLSQQESMSQASVILSASPSQVMEGVQVVG